MGTLHTGKLTQEAKTMVTESMDEYITELAKQAKCHPSELIREALYKIFSGDTYSGHVSNDRLAVMKLEGLSKGEKRASE